MSKRSGLRLKLDFSQKQKLKLIESHFSLNCTIRGFMHLIWQLFQSNFDAAKTSFRPFFSPSAMRWFERKRKIWMPSKTPPEFERPTVSFFNYLLLSCYAGVHAVINPTLCSYPLIDTFSLQIFLVTSLSNTLKVHQKVKYQNSQIFSSLLPFKLFFKFEISSSSDFFTTNTWCFFKSILGRVVFDSWDVRHTRR